MDWSGRERRLSGYLFGGTRQKDQRESECQRQPGYQFQAGEPPKTAKQRGRQPVSQSANQPDHANEEPALPASALHGSRPAVRLLIQQQNNGGVHLSSSVCSTSSLETSFCSSLYSSAVTFFVSER